MFNKNTRLTGNHNIIIIYHKKKTGVMLLHSFLFRYREYIYRECIRFIINIFTHVSYFYITIFYQITI
jgi:hypothetical protein